MCNHPDLTKKEDGVLVSEWVLGFYPDEELCKHKVVRAVRVKDGVEWEYADGQGVDADVFPINDPASWAVIES